jgi:cadmium resistance protein CadD (predicted permease)
MPDQVTIVLLLATGFLIGFLLAVAGLARTRSGLPGAQEPLSMRQRWLLVALFILLGLLIWRASTLR